MFERTCYLSHFRSFLFLPFSLFFKFYVFIRLGTSKNFLSEQRVQEVARFLSPLLVPHRVKIVPTTRDFSSRCENKTPRPRRIRSS